MKSIRTRVIALLTVCTIGVACSACGQSSSDESSSAENSTSNENSYVIVTDENGETATDENGDVVTEIVTNNDSAEDDDNDDDANDDNEETLSPEEIEAMQIQDMTIYSYEVDESSGSNAPINEGVSQNSSSDDSDTEDSSSSEDSYVIVTDESGEPTTDESGTVVTEVVSSGNSSSEDSYVIVTDENGEEATDEDGTVVTEVVTSDSSYTSSIVGKLVYWLNMSSGDQVFNGDFITVTFKVKEDIPDGNYAIGIDTCDFANYDAETITYSSTDGYVTVGDAETPSVETNGDGTIQLACVSTTASQGDEITVHFTMENNPGIVALIFRFTYDQNALEYISFDVGEDCADYIDLAS